MRFFIVSFAIASVLLGLGLAFIVDLKTLTVYPFDNTSKILVGISHEEIASGYSTGSYKIDSNNILHFSYRLSTEVNEPFAGIYLHKADSTKDLFFDFSGFDLISIHLKADKAKRIPVFLTLDYNGFTTAGKKLSWLPLVAVIEYIGEGNYEIKKSDFEIPSWWLRLHGMKKEDFNNINFSRVTNVLVNSCQTLGPDKDDEIQISNVTFLHNNQQWVFLYGTVMITAIGIFGLIYILKKKRKVLVPYQMSGSDTEKSDSKIDKIINFFAKNYANPELSVGDLQKALGFSEREIGVLIKKQLDSSFKSYLNTIRLSEVKRLLIESDKAVSEIAYLTGYNNIPHFNRVFKKEFDTTPKEFREKSKN